MAVKSKDFSSLSREQISRLISSSKLLVSSEGEVYKAVVSWVAHDPKNRANILPALLQHVHFPLMSMDEVEQSSRSHLVKKNKNLATALEEARTYLAKVGYKTRDYQSLIASWSEHSSEARLLELQTQTGQVAKNLCGNEDVLEKSAHGVLRLQTEKVSISTARTFRSFIYSQFKCPLWMAKSQLK